MSTTTATRNGTPATRKVARMTGDISREEFLALGEHLGYHDLLAREPQLPVESLREAIPFLRRPFTADAVRWKVQTQYPKENPTAGMVVAYIDARLVIARLNLVVADLWHDEYERMSDGMLCRLTVGGVTRRDIGDGKGKGSYSDALKRAAVRFGIGESLYAIPALRVRAGSEVGELPVRGPQGKRTLRIEGDQQTWLRSRYEGWLETLGMKAFGEPLDHGDQLGAAGDPFDLDQQDGEEEATERLFDDDAPPAASGKKIGKQRADDLVRAAGAKQIPEQAMHDKLAELTGKRDATDWVPLLRSLRESQAVEFERWVAGLGA